MLSLIVKRDVIKNPNVGEIAVIQPRLLFRIFIREIMLFRPALSNAGLYKLNFKNKEEIVEFLEFNDVFQAMAYLRTNNLLEKI